MNFTDRLEALAERVEANKGKLATEEAAKNALVMPFIQALGYDVFDPTVVVPEFTADVGIKKGEKVDYAILRDGDPSILVECKPVGGVLEVEHASQLYRYFSVTPARVGILTDGVRYRFYSDLDAPNLMDERPFLDFEMTSLGPRVIEELRGFTRDAFDVEQVLSAAKASSYRRGLRRAINEEWANPSPEFIRHFAGRVYGGRLTQSVMDEFGGLLKTSLADFVSERVNHRLQAALDGAASVADTTEGGEDPEEVITSELDSEIHTTEDELEAFFIVRAIVSADIDPKRVFMRDRKSYCGVLLDDNNRKPICRLHFNGSRYYVGLFDENKEEDRIPIESVLDMHAHAERLRQTVAAYLR